jgi:hypothetical protein
MSLPRWGSVSFLHMQIRVDGHWRPASTFAAIRIDMIRGGKVLATAGPLLASSAFTAYQR